MALVLVVVHLPLVRTEQLLLAALVVRDLLRLFLVHLLTTLAVVGVVFFAWPGRFFATASAILSLVALTPVALMATGQATVGWGLITCGASCVALGLASLARMKAGQ